MSFLKNWKKKDENLGKKKRNIYIHRRGTKFATPKCLLRVPQQGDPTSQSRRKSILNIHWKDWCWSSNTLATWCEEPTHWKRPWCWERLKAWGEGDDRGRAGWIESLAQWTWVCKSPGRWWRTGKAGELQSVGLQRVRHDWMNNTRGCVCKSIVGMPTHDPLSPGDG